jgi:hypothetical protein
MLIYSVSLLYFRCQINCYFLVSSVYIVIQTNLLARLQRNKTWSFGNSKHIYFTPTPADQLWLLPVSFPIRSWVL